MAQPKIGENRAKNNWFTRADEHLCGWTVVVMMLLLLSVKWLLL